MKRLALLSLTAALAVACQDLQLAPPNSSPAFEIYGRSVETSPDELFTADRHHFIGQINTAPGLDTWIMFEQAQQHIGCTGCQI